MEKSNIMIVEDDSDIREGVRILLEGEGFMVEEAENGHECLKYLTGETDLVILDIMMPGISGIKTCEEIRKVSKIPILFLTAKTKESDKLLGFMAGGDDYLGRIMNNVISNIEKYGDNSREVQIKIKYDQNRVGLSIQNVIALPNQYVQGTGIGVENIRRMMDNMQGNIDVNMSEETYCIVLWFPEHTLK